MLPTRLISVSVFGEGGFDSVADYTHNGHKKRRESYVSNPQLHPTLFLFVPLPDGRDFAKKENRIRLKCLMIDRRDSTPEKLPSLV